MTRMPLMAGNWKMNLNHLEAIALVQKLAFSLNDKDLDAVEVAVLPPFTDIRSVQTLIDGDKYRLSYGAQDVSAHEKGAYTGEVSASMLAKLGCTYVVIGHSERRQYHHEDDALINAKVKQAVAHELTPILCIGESLEVRQAGDHVAHTVGQLDGRARATSRPPRRAAWSSPTSPSGPSARARSPPRTTRRRSAPRSAPSWPSSIPATWPTASASSTAGRSRRRTSPAIMDQTDVDGALVGGASIDGEEFVAICRYRDMARQIGVLTPTRGRTCRTLDPHHRTSLTSGDAPVNSLRKQSHRVIIVFDIVLVITSLLMIVLVLLHKGKGGGLSDLFGGGVSSSLGGSSVVERNLDRITIGTGILWIASIVGLGLLLKA